MKDTIRAALAALAVVAMGTGPQARAATPKTVFACSLGKKRVSVTAVGDRFIYRFGTPARTEMTITGSAARGNAFFRSARYAGIEYQIRFTNGPYSYLVYSVGGNNAGAHAGSGLVVMKGMSRIADMPCARAVPLDYDFYGSQLPEDSEAYSPM